MPDVAAALRHVAVRYPAVAVSYVVLHDPRTAGQHVRIVGLHERRLIFGKYYGFDARGRFLGTVRLTDGRWVNNCRVLGIAVTAICATGTHIWLGKRRRRGHVEPILRAARQRFPLTSAICMMFGTTARREVQR